MGRRKYLGEPYEKIIKTHNTKKIRIDENNLKGYASYMKIHEVNYSFIVDLNGSKLCLYDNGYSEINYLPDNENWQFYGIYDNNENIIEWYFDITQINTIDENNNPYCDDLYLDIVLKPNGEIIILDEDELKEALNGKKITKEEYEMAYNVKNNLINDGIIEVNYMKKLCKRIYELLEIKAGITSSNKR